MVSHRGWGSTRKLIPDGIVAKAAPDKLSPFLNVADHVPLQISDDTGSFSDMRSVPSPRSESLIAPDQLPTGDTVADVFGRDIGNTAVGEAGVALLPQPATPTAIAIASTGRTAITLIEPTDR